MTGCDERKERRRETRFLQGNGFPADLRQESEDMRQMNGWMRRLAWVGCAVGLILGAIGCGGGQKESIIAAGSTAFQPFCEKLAEAYMAEHPGAQIAVQGGGSSVGIQSALSGAAQIGMADMVELPPEAKRLHTTIVARDGVALIVNPANAVSQLTSEQVRGIFSGQILNWKEVGGADALITVISREEGSGTRKSFDALMLKPAKLAKDALIQDSNGTIREAVAGDPHSISYLTISLVNEKVKALKLDGVVPTNEDVIEGKYKIARPVYILTRGEPTGLAKEFTEYVLSPQGQKMISEDGLIPARR
jgi:phosphate transport system substrate-binding protein